MISFMLLSLFSGLSAQENDIKAQILSYKDSDYNFINKGRRLLIDNLQASRIEEAINVKNALLNEFDGNVSEVFYNIEYIHLLYWTGEFGELLNYLRQVDFEQSVSNNVRFSSQTDNFSKAVYAHTIENKDILEIDIKNGELDDMERDFLLLLLNEIVSSSSQNDQGNLSHIDKINEQADQFLANHPGSPYEKLVREQIRFVVKDSHWGSYMDFGLATVLYQGDLSRQFNPGVGVDLLFEYRHRQLMGMFGAGVLSSTLRQDFQIKNTTWKKGSGATLGSVYLNAGFLVFENHKWSIYPYAGVGFTGYEAVENDTKEDENLKKLGLNSFFTQLGVGIDLKIKSFFIDNLSPYRSSTDSRISLRYSYRKPHFERKDPLLSGSQHLITLSWGLGGRGKERDL